MKNEKIKNLLKNVNVDYKESKSKNDLFTPHHTKFICEISNEKGNYIFTYQCNTAYTMPNKNSLLACCLSDARCYQDCLIGSEEDNLQEFAMMFGYDNDFKALFKAFKGCKEAYLSLNKMFTTAEQEELYNYFLELGEI